MMEQEIKFWDIDNMYQYSLQAYPLPDGIKNDPATLIYYEETTKKAIQRKIKELGFPQLQADTGRKKYQLPYDYARFFIDVTMYEYFTKDKEGTVQKYRQHEDKRREKEFDDTKKKSAPKDIQLGIDARTTDLKETLLDPKTNPGDKLIEKVTSCKWYKGKYHILPNNEPIDKKCFEYHIPPVTFDELNSDPEIVDKIIDRMMLRTLFDMFFDFDEVSFRQNVYERSTLIKKVSGTDVEPLDGYSELTAYLEDPFRKYIQKKKK